MAVAPSLISEPLWQEASSANISSEFWRQWLLDPASLTQKLIDYSQDNFQVQVLAESMVKPLPSEAELLDVGIDELTWQREVLLLCHDVPCVYARTIIPQESFETVFTPVANLGNRSLGQLLFSDPQVARGELQVAKRVNEYVPQLEGLHPVCGRRSIFSLDGHQALVTEIFLQQLK